MDVRNKLSALKARKFGDDLNEGEIIKNFSGSVSDDLLYISEAMAEVNREYTKNTYLQCDRVQQQLKNNISDQHSGIVFEYQGSVPLNTHTRRHSDVDILIATGRYHWVTPPLPVVNPYLGDEKNDLIELRNDVVATIRSTFPAVLIDNTGGKAVAISGGSLTRKMDLVPVSWVHNINSSGKTDLTHRGIRLYDNKKKEYVENYPFLHIDLCNTKDSIVNGRFKKLVRYIKNVRKDSDQRIDISSYDATALMYLQSNSELAQTLNNPASLSRLAETHLARVIGDTSLRQTAMVPNGTRLLFGDDGLKLSEVIKLYQDIAEINRNLTQSYRNIDPYRIRVFEDYFQKAI
jgi:hypothetical protein